MMIVCKGLSSKNCANCLPTVAGNGANPKWKLFPTTTPRALNLANHEATRAGKTKSPFPGSIRNTADHTWFAIRCVSNCLKGSHFWLVQITRARNSSCAKRAPGNRHVPFPTSTRIRTPCPNNNHPAQTNTERIGPST